MKTPSSFVVYIDESGVEGFIFKEDDSGSSRWLALSAVGKPLRDRTPPARG